MRAQIESVNSSTLASQTSCSHGALWSRSEFPCLRMCARTGALDRRRPEAGSQLHKQASFEPEFGGGGAFERDGGSNSNSLRQCVPFCPGMHAYH